MSQPIRYVALAVGLMFSLVSTAWCDSPTSEATSQAAAAAPIQSARIEVHADKVLGPVNRKVLGSNVLAANKWIIHGVNWKKLPASRFPYIRTGAGVWDPVRMRPDPQAVKMIKALRPGPMRYPGGNLVHGYDWKQAVGPVSERGHWKFGIDEYMTFCKAVGSEPQFTVNEYSSSPQEAAQLVEYLNAPATPDHPWAMKRKKWGHAEPYGVKYFEFGNETNAGNQKMKPPKRYSGSEYAKLFKRTAAAMRAVDPTIKLGIVTTAGKPPTDRWNIAVFKEAGPAADFVIVHTYTVWYHSNAPHVDENRMMRACLAADQQKAHELAVFRGLIRKYVGRDLPLAITEYNALFVQMKPKPYRYSYGPALFCADYVRVMLQPSSNILLANYFELSNGYWGMIHDRNKALAPMWKGDPGLRGMAAYPLYVLWGQHLGDQVTAVNVTSPKLTFEGFSRTAPARGDHYQPPKKLNDKPLATAKNLARFNRKMIATSTTPDGIYTITLKGMTGSNYPNLATIELPENLRVAAGAGQVRVSYEAKYESDADANSVRLGLGLMDARGWKATHTAIGVPGIHTARDWTHFEGKLSLPPSTKGVIVVGRLRAGTKPISGKIYIRDLRVDVLRPQIFPAYPALTAFSSISNDGKTLSLIVFNKSTKSSLDTTIDLAGFDAASARYWQVTGPSLAANNFAKPLIKMTTKDQPLPLTSPRTLRCAFPPISMTAIEVHRK